MALLKHNNNSISNVTSFAQVPAGDMKLLSTATASSSASIEFNSTYINSDYKIYKLEVINLNQTTGEIVITFNLSSDNGSNYNVVKTSTLFKVYHNEADTITSLSYDTGGDLAQSTGGQRLTVYDHLGNGSDKSLCATIYLFNPSSTTFVKHYLATSQYYTNANASESTYSGGYANTTNAINAIQLICNSGNIASGTFKLYGIGAN